MKRRGIVSLGGGRKGRKEREKVGGHDGSILPGGI